MQRVVPRATRGRRHLQGWACRSPRPLNSGTAAAAVPPCGLGASRSTAIRSRHILTAPHPESARRLCMQAAARAVAGAGAHSPSAGWLRAMYLLESAYFVATHATWHVERTAISPFSFATRSVAESRIASNRARSTCGSQRARRRSAECGGSPLSRPRPGSQCCSAC